MISDSDRSASPGSTAMAGGRRWLEPEESEPSPDWFEGYRAARAELAEKVRGLRAVDCPDCFGDGFVVETTADPNEFGEPGEPYQVQVGCAHPRLFLRLIEDPASSEGGEGREP